MLYLLHGPTKTATLPLLDGSADLEVTKENIKFSLHSSLVLIKVQRVCGAHLLNLRQGTQFKFASVASRWQLVLI